MNKIRCLVVGVGYLGKFHAEKFARMPQAELVGVCDANYERSQEIAKLYDVAAYDDYQQLIGKIDAVSIASTTSTHFQVAKFFLENHVHVLVEKPITTTLDEAEELIAIAERNHLILQVGHLERFNPVVIQIKKVMRQPLYIETIRLAPYKLRGADVNVVLDMMIHDIDIIHDFVKSPIKQISANGLQMLSNQIDVANARIEFVNGCVANCTASRISSKLKREISVFETDGYFIGDLNNHSLVVHRPGINTKAIPPIPEIICEETILEKSDALRDEIAAFIDAIATKASPIISGIDGKRALETAIKITQIASENLVIKA